ncbi:uncharacterized protein LOC115447705 [Manduca sexta]|uniref:uncharacterized protein LOC115447705 n=1 Tax=Manduca sexta TaxID=7130 RepID=UPI00188E4334|nr:uncharacterized protein LOC115447705 [Manduca sexta]
MTSKCNLLIIIYLIMGISGNFQDLDLPNYDYNSYNENNFRKKFIANKKGNVLKNKRTNLLDKYLFNNTVYLNGIIHYEINENNTKYNKINSVENEFKFVLAMDGVKYTYKRGSKWRTWRELVHDGDKKIICYICENIVKGNCSNCHGGGHWTIEDKPPCPYEIFSIKEENEICAKYYTQYTTTDDCPSIIKFENLSVSCDNPIETKWQITRDYRNIKYFPAFICNGKEYCEMTTIYTIDQQGISFRIINSSNNIIYSRIMRNGGKNYACIDDCGYWDPNTKKISSQQHPLSFDLLGKNKKKREDIYGTTVTTLKSSKQLKKSTKPYKNRHLSMAKSAGIKSILELNVESTTMSHCKKLEKMDQEYEDEESDYEY